MAENIGALILPIGADASQFNRSINDVKAAFKELSNTIASTPFNLVTDKQKLQLNALKETLTVLTTDVKLFGEAVKIPENSILGLTNRIAELNKKKISLDAKTSASEIARLTKEIEKLTAQKNNIDNLGRSVSQIGSSSQGGFKKVEDASKGARTALTSLSLVAQDAPFGFIAIQNNLPAVIASFGELSRGANGLKGAFAQVGSALVGPAGLFLAFSVVTGAVTFAVQKYGSLSNAITALVSDNEELAKTIAKARKEYETYNNSINGIELSLKKSQASEQGRIETIKILTETVSNLQISESKRSNALNQLKSIDKDYYGSFTTSAEDADKLRKATDQLTESIIKQARVKGLESRITEITTALLDIEDAQSKVAPAFTESGKKVEQSLKKASQFGALTFQDVGEVINLDNITTQLQEGDAAIEKETDRLQKTKERLAAELDGIINLGKSTGDKNIPGIRQIIEGTQGEGIITTNLALFERYIQGQVRINNAGVDQMVRYRREQLNALDLIPKKVEKEVGTLGLSLPFGPEAQKNLQQYYLGLFEIEGIYQRFKDAQMSGANEFARLQEQIKQFNNLKDSIENNLTKPFRDFFDELLTNGKVSFDGFVELAKDAFKRILAQALASGIANLIAAALFGGGSLAFGKLGAAKKISSTLSGFGKIGGLFGTANFGGVQGGSMQMAGAVNLTLRGSDLVASINRTNSTINRVG